MEAMFGSFVHISLLLYCSHGLNWPIERGGPRPSGEWEKQGGGARRRRPFYSCGPVYLYGPSCEYGALRDVRAPPTARGCEGLARKAQAPAQTQAQAQTPGQSSADRITRGRSGGRLAQAARERRKEWPRASAQHHPGRGTEKKYKGSGRKTDETRRGGTRHKKKSKPGPAPLEAPLLRVRVVVKTKEKKSRATPPPPPSSIYFFYLQLPHRPCSHPQSPCFHTKPSERKPEDRPFARPKREKAVCETGERARRETERSAA